MLLSVLIVNYKVPRLAEQAVRSVLESLKQIEGDGEIIQLDNASGDGSVPYLTEALAPYPEVHIIAGERNGGFARGNNLAAQSASGTYLLLLNPDTLVGESALRTCLSFLQSHPEAGAVGPRLINVHGGFHPESKRGLPTPWAALCRMLRLYRLAPRSAFLNGYYCGHLSPDAVQQVPVLTGAFLMMKRSLYKQAGGLDERYFMYGEDIDLCYTIERAGYKNYYLPTPVLHYKGESEHAVHRARYYSAFYDAMRLFYLKHRRDSLWDKLKTPCILGAIELQRLRAKSRFHREKTVSPPASSPTLLPISVEHLDSPEKRPPAGSHLLIDLSATTYDALLHAMEATSEAGYTYHFHHGAAGDIVSPSA